jgi:hypothetical protein
MNFKYSLCASLWFRGRLTWNWNRAASRVYDDDDDDDGDGTSPYIQMGTA